MPLTMSDDEDMTSSDEEPHDILQQQSAASLAAQGRRNWEESFQALIAYRTRYGNCLVPSAYGEDSALGHWVRKQRRNDANGSLSPAKRDKLDQLGFVWKLRGDQYAGQKSNPGPASQRNNKNRNWTESFDAMKKYAKQNGHCNVPRRYPPDRALGQWVYKQRIQKHKLSRKQREKLETIGFVFELRNEKTQREWDEKLALLRAFRVKHGDCNVPSDYSEDELGSWVAEQRKAYSEDRLSSDCVNALDALGFSGGKDEESEFDEEEEANKTPTPRVKVTLAERWESQYDLLVRFHRTHGHCVVARTQNKTLSYWVQRQRMLNLQSKLKQNRKDMLDDLNFEWYLGVNQLPEHYFDEMIQRLIQFKEAEGHVDVPRRYLRGGLGEWVDEIKAKGCDGLLHPDEADRLLRVGFSWMENRDSWYQSFDEAAFEVKNCCRYNTFSLSQELENWLKVQFMLLDYDLLPTRRKEKVDSLGLEWDGQTFSWKEGSVVGNGRPDNGMVLDDEISTGFDLKGAAMAWTPDRDAVRVVANDDLPSDGNPDDTGLPAVGDDVPKSPDRVRDDGNNGVATNRLSTSAPADLEEASKEHGVTSNPSTSVEQTEKAAEDAAEGSGGDLMDGTISKEGGNPKPPSQVNEQVDGQQPPKKKAKTEDPGS